ncbi:MAG TPA: rhomboid family intramembrane serine protease [Solirubrobacteraceae bacterium]|nr:rhomboid family intramembrane serine protease [Solirubrobacteraceae bacterium]
MSRADLYVVCKNPDCGAEVSPYITECPYCGTRLQKRAPKLNKALKPARRPRRMPAPSLGRLRPGEIPGIRADSRPYATGAIIVATGGVWIATRAGWLAASSWVLRGPFHAATQWPHLITAPFTYFYTGGANLTGTGVYQFATLFAVAIFGWLLERRHGPLVTAGVFLLGAVGGTYVAVLVQNGPDANLHIAGANGGALALLCAWAVPDLLARRTRRDYDGDLLGTGVIALVLLAMPLARPEASPIAGGFGVLSGYLGGLALAHRRSN